MFHPDNIKNYVEGTKMSESVNKYWKVLGGAKGLASKLNTDLKVNLIEMAHCLCRMVSKAITKILKLVTRSNPTALFIKLFFRYGANKKRIPKIKGLWELIIE